jgi:hypothetical protein
MLYQPSMDAGSARQKAATKDSAKMQYGEWKMQDARGEANTGGLI